MRGLSFSKKTGDIVKGVWTGAEKHKAQYTKPQFKKRRDKHGHVKIIKVR